MLAEDYPSIGDVISKLPWDHPAFLLFIALIAVCVAFAVFHNRGGGDGN